MSFGCRFDLLCQTAVSVHYFTSSREINDLPHNFALIGVVQGGGCFKCQCADNEDRRTDGGRAGFVHQPFPTLPFTFCCMGALGLCDMTNRTACFARDVFLEKFFLKTPEWSEVMNEGSCTRGLEISAHKNAAASHPALMLRNQSLDISSALVSQSTRSPSDGLMPLPKRRTVARKAFSQPQWRHYHMSEWF